MTPDALVAAVQARGSDATTARDAAHEACHALAWGVTKKWTRDNIHAKKPRSRPEGLGDEITARAVEAKVCEKLGMPCGSCYRSNGHPCAGVGAMTAVIAWAVLWSLAGPVTGWRNAGAASGREAIEIDRALATRTAPGGD